MAYSRLFSTRPTLCETTATGVTLALIASAALMMNVNSLLKGMAQESEPLPKGVSFLLLGCEITFGVVASVLGGYLGYWAGRGAIVADRLEQHDEHSRVYRV